MDGRVKLRIWKMGKLPSDRMALLIRNLWNRGYTLEHLDCKRPLRSISISTVGFGSRLTLTPSLEMVIPNCSRNGRCRGLVSPSRLPEVYRVFSDYLFITATAPASDDFLSSYTHSV